MSKNISELTPVARLDKPPVTMMMDLPYRFQNKIGVDLHRIGWLRRIGGISNLRLKMDTEGKITSSAPIPNGLLGNIFTTTAEHIEQAPVGLIEHDLDEINLLLKVWSNRKRVLYPNLSLTLNQNEMQRRILQSKEKVTEPEAWVNELNRVFSTLIIQHGKEHLLGNFTWNDISFYSTFIFLSLTSSLHSARETATNLDEFAQIFSEEIRGFLLMLNVYEWIVLSAYNWKQGRRIARISVFGPLEIDRYLLLYYLAKTKPVFAVLPAKNIFLGAK